MNEWMKEWMEKQTITTENWYCTAQIKSMTCDILYVKILSW
jgi:hypothetical protein